ncbi:MAG: hypothetical protein ACKOKH_08145, partial [Bacteroidota bacterium]
AKIHGHQATRPMPKPAEAPRRKPLHADSPTGSIPQTRLLPGISALKDGAAGLTTPEIYLHAQVQALPFYRRLGFAQVGELFYEADIPHYRCVYQDPLNV